jgi:hypothetical protein
LGTSKSDIDLMLVAPPGEGVPATTERVPLQVGPCLVDLWRVPSTTVDELLDRLDEWASGPWDVSHLASFTIIDRKLLNWFHTAQLLHAGEAAVPRAPSPSDLARLKLHVARYWARTIQVDMAGLRDEGDYRSLVAAGQDLLGHTLDALTAGHGLVNPQQKWRSRVLDAVPLDWQREVIMPASEEPAWSCFWRLGRAPVEPAAEPVLAHSFDIVSFSRSIFHWAERRLIDGTLGVVGVPHRRAPARAGAFLPRLDLDIDFGLADGNCQIGRLNATDEGVAVSEHEVAAALFFDGRTVAGEAAAALFSDEREGLRVVEGLVSRLTSAGLLASG